MQKGIKNKAVVQEETKSTEEIKTKLIDVVLRNTTDINWKLFARWLNKLTPEEFEAVKKFL